MEEIEEAGVLIQDIWKDGKSPDYFRGVLDLFSRLILLPKKLCQPNDVETIEDMVNQDFKQVELTILRNAVRK